jgi:hypothetical protein
MNPNSNLRELLISKNEQNETSENNKINKQINRNNNNEKKIEFSKEFMLSTNYSNTLNTHLIEKLDLSNSNQSFNNFYFCCYCFTSDDSRNSDKYNIKYGLTFNENKILSFPKIKTKMNMNEKTTTSEIITRIKTYTQICFGLKPDLLTLKGFLIYDNNCYCFFENESISISSEKYDIVNPVYSVAKPPREIVWASLHEICNLQTLAKNNIDNNIVENNIIQPDTGILFFEHPFLIP